jgi:hypothetical protein
MKRQQEPTEQLLTQEDFGGIYKSRNSPQQNTTIKVEGGTIALAIALVALGGVLVAAIMLPQLMRVQAEATAANVVQPVADRAMQASERSYVAQTDSKLNAEYLKVLQIELAKRGIFVQVDGHH